MRWALLALAACSAPVRVVAPPAPPHVTPPPPPAFASFPEAPPFRLPHTFEPARYALRIALGDTRFTGHVEITGDVREPLPLLWLHGNDLVVHTATATHDGIVVPLAFSAPREDQVLGFRPPTPLAPGPWTIAIDYDGPIRDRETPDPRKRYGYIGQPVAVGVFRRIVDGATYVFTQGEPIHARMIVPCIDEPDRKVPWQLTLDVPASDVAASNTPIVRTTPLDATHTRVEFAETPPLPSYLLAFAAGPFDVVDAPGSAMPIRVLALRGHGRAVAPAATVAPRMLDELARWLDVPYRYGKLDLVDVPDLGISAMENPGLVTVHQHVLEGRDPAPIIGHELAHQWFGDLVTLAWWDDIWLNEAFAVFVEDKLERELLPKQAFDPVATRLAGLEVSTFGREIPAPASNADLALDRFNPMSIENQGAALLKLVEVHVGAERFRSALHDYLIAHADGNVTTRDLLAALPSDATTKDLVAGVVPVVDAELRCGRSPRLHLDTNGAQVHMCIAYDRDGTRGESCAAVDADHPDVALRAKRCPHWFMPDAGGLGMYRINWTTSSLDALLRTGWPQLTEPEEQTLFGETRDEDRRLAIFVRAVDAGTADALPDVADYLADLARYVPDDLRPAFAAWIEARYGARARTIGLAPTTAISPTDLPIVHLVARIRDPELTKQAASIARDYRSWPGDYELGPDVVGLAAAADPEVATSLLDAALHESRSWRQYQLVLGLGTVRGTVDLFAHDHQRFDKLTASDAYRLFEAVCDAEGRHLLADLAGSAPRNTSRWLLTRVDACITTRATLEPRLRRWLGAASRP